MNDWITDRLPRSMDATVDGLLFIHADGELRMCHWSVVRKGEPWATPVEPPAYIPPKPKRASVWMDGARQMWNVAQKSKNCEHEYKEVLPGDPADLDEFLQAFDRWQEAGMKGGLHGIRHQTSMDMIEARKPRQQLCPHGNPPHDCNDCDVQSDFAYDAAREQ